MTGGELKNWRIKAGLTQAQLAEQLGVTSNTVARWERDEMSMPPHVNLAAISKSPQAYIDHVMRENGLTLKQVADRASRTSHRLSVSNIQMLLQGKVVNPGIYTVKALAMGLGRPEQEVFAAFGVCAERASRVDPDIEAITLTYGMLSRTQQHRLKPVIKMLSREIRHLLNEEL